MTFSNTKDTIKSSARQCEEPKGKTNFCSKDIFHGNGEEGWGGEKAGRATYNTERTQYVLGKSPKCYRIQSTTKEGESILRLVGEKESGNCHNEHDIQGASTKTRA